MCRASVAIDAAMFAAAVGVDARIKAYIRALIVGNDALGSIVEKLSEG